MEVEEKTSEGGVERRQCKVDLDTLVRRSSRWIEAGQNHR